HMRILSSILVLTIFCVPGAKAAAGCFSEHLEEAIASNEARRAVYAGLTEGATEALSDELIASERLSKIAGHLFDLRARRYERAGVPILCEGFISMSKTPPVQTAKLEGADPIEMFVRADADRLKREFRNALDRGGFAAVLTLAKTEIGRLKSPTYNCMLRHGLESIARFAWLAPKHERMALERGLRSSAGISRHLILSHILGMDKFVELDTRAAPFQARGVAIICRDVPPIPFGPDAPAHR
ncbi:MAG TPA: hypothetical protein VFV50_04140, partial [Bdellovibrionales bacterium]|nr:hypothetical protein [Bdellovibrionales bacterium]